MGIIIFSISFFVYLFNTPRWLEDWDSVQFAMALHNFDIGQNLPHAPGYPLYVLLGRFMYLLIQNDTLALTTLSSIMGAGSIVLIYFISSKMFNKSTGILAAILTFFIPIHFLMSVSALTNIVGLFFLLMFVHLVIKFYKTHPTFLYFFGGLILGFRFTEIPVIAGILLLVYLQKPNLKNIIIFSSVFVLGICSWLVPMIIVVGLKDFISSYGWITNYILTHDSYASSDFSRIPRIIKLLGYGFNNIFIFVFIISLFKILVERKNWKNFNYQLILVWLICYSLPLLLVYNLEVTRYLLPLVPPLTIITSHALLSFKHVIGKVSSIVITLFVGFVLFNQSSLQIKIFKTETPPSIAPILYVQKNFNAVDTIIFGSYIYRQFQYYLPMYKSFYETPPSSNDVSNAKFVIIDYIGLKEKLPKNFKYEIIKQHDFFGDTSIFTRIQKTTLTVLEVKHE